jgi:hypothetical protein
MLEAARHHTPRGRVMDNEPGERDEFPDERHSQTFVAAAASLVTHDGDLRSARLLVDDQGEDSRPHSPWVSPVVVGAASSVAWRSTAEMESRPCCAIIVRPRRFMPLSCRVCEDKESHGLPTPAGRGVDPEKAGSASGARGRVLRSLILPLPDGPPLIRFGQRPVITCVGGRGVHDPDKLLEPATGV